MRHEKIIQRDGFKIKIAVSICQYGRSIDYNIDWVQILPKRKRNWKDVYCFEHDYQWRSLGMEERKKYAVNKYLDHVTKEEINEALTELWEKLKPTLLQ